MTKDRKRIEAIMMALRMLFRTPIASQDEAVGNAESPEIIENPENRRWE